VRTTAKNHRYNHSCAVAQRNHVAPHTLLIIRAAKAQTTERCCRYRLQRSLLATIYSGHH